MATRHRNHRLAKIHLNYTVEEIARLYGVTRDSVRRWIKGGLPTTDDKRPMLILGCDLGAFVQAQRSKNKRPCQPGELYCMRCRVPRRPAGDLVEYQPVNASRGKLIGICPHCDAIMNRGASLTKLAQIRGNLDVTLPQASPHLGESPQPSVNHNLERSPRHDQNTQPRKRACEAPLPHVFEGSEGPKRGDG